MSDQTPYDPTAPEGDRGGSQYITKKDFKVVSIALAVLAVALYPIYKVMLGNSERARCISNLKAISESINLYAGEHDNRYPPLARTLADGFTPNMDLTKNPYTWVSDVAGFMNKRQSFRCPSATDEEVAFNESLTSSSEPVVSSYGFYTPYASELISNVDSPDDVVLVADSSNHGAKGTKDPLKFDPYDGFALGWSDSNVIPSKTTQWVTRLAIGNPEKGAAAESRHGNFIQGISAAGTLVRITPEQAAYNSDLGINTHWKLPPGYRPVGN